MSDVLSPFFDSSVVTRARTVMAPRTGHGAKDGFQPFLPRLPALIDHREHAVDDVAHVVRRHVRRHSDRDSG
jgi:hypothetical protein